MIWLALKMLTGDRAKYLGIIFGVTFASLLMAHQISIFISLMARTTSVIRDVREADIWVMDPNTRYIDEALPLADTDVDRVRSVAGVEWAVRLFKGSIRARLAQGNEQGVKGDFRQVILIGVDDNSLIGLPRTLVMGDIADLKKPDAVIVDTIGYNYLWPGQPFRLGQVLEMNDCRAVVVGICEANPPFLSNAIFYTRYSNALNFAPPERRLLTFLVVKAQEGVNHNDLCQRIQQQTRLKAVTQEAFCWETIQFYLSSTGIPVNFGITVMLGFVVGVAIAGQTFYLFTLENLKQFGALKAMGLSNLRIIGMILTQGFTVGCIGYGLGMGLAAIFFEGTGGVPALKGFHMYWEIMLIAAGAVTVIVVLASLLSIRKVLFLEPAVVFR